MKIISKCIKTKRHLCASGSILLPLAQKWGLVGMIVCGLSLFGAGNVSAASITLTVSPKPITFSITPSPDGTFGKSSAGTIKITTDALAGYTLSIKSQNGSDLVNSTLSNNKIVSIDKDVTESDFRDKKDYNNKWGFAYYQQNASNLTFHPGPDNINGTQIGASEAPNSREETYSIVLGTRIDSVLATGEYSNTFVVTASANPVPYTITYNKNTEDKVDGMPEGGSGSTNADTEVFSLSDDEPTRKDYAFVGWCNKKPTSNNDMDYCNDGEFYKPNDKVTLTEKNETITLYAVWAKPTQIMQGWTGCSDLTISTPNDVPEDKNQVVLVDNRDGKQYYVAKLADGYCWMTQNLDLDLNKDRSYTPEDTDVKTAWSPLESTHKPSDTSWQMAGGSTGYGIVSPQSYDPGEKCWIGTRSWSSRDGHDITDLVDCRESANPEHYSIGNYYNYSAAVAQNNTSSMIKDNLTDGVTASESGYDTSICPAGWQLPANKGERSFDNLKTEANATAPLIPGYVDKKTDGQTTDKVSTVHKAPYYFVYGGLWAGKHLYFGFEGDYRTNATSSELNSYYLIFNGVGAINQQASYGFRRDGFLVRCIARE